MCLNVAEVEGPIFSVVTNHNGIFCVGSGGGGARVGVRNYVTAYSAKKNEGDGLYGTKLRTQHVITKLIS